MLYLPWSGIAKFLGAATALVCGSIFAIGSLWPNRFRTGVVVFDGGFELFAGLRGGQLVRFIDIVKIVAVQTGGGGQGDEVMLEISTRNEKVRLGEGDLFNTDLHNILFKLPGFQHGQYSNAADHQLRGLDHFRLKRFTVFERSSALSNHVA